MFPSQENPQYTPQFNWEEIANPTDLFVPVAQKFGRRYVKECSTKMETCAMGCTTKAQLGTRSYKHAAHAHGYPRAYPRVAALLWICYMPLILQHELNQVERDVSVRKYVDDMVLFGDGQRMRVRNQRGFQSNQAHLGSIRDEAQKYQVCVVVANMPLVVWSAAVLGTAWGWMSPSQPETWVWMSSGDRGGPR
eukprot:6314111-Amphidinium_carterae.1